MTKGDEHVRVFISYSQEDPEHREAVSRLRQLLTKDGIKVIWDKSVEPRVWIDWMGKTIRDVDYIFMIASAGYKIDGEEPSARDPSRARGQGVAAEAMFLQGFLNRDPHGFMLKVLPVVLPGQSPNDFPSWLTANNRRNYYIPELSQEGITELLNLIQRTADGGPASENFPGGPPGLSKLPAEFGRAVNTFRGRKAALREISQWLQDNDNRSSRLVTSGPGSGKTALLGVVAYLGTGNHGKVNLPLVEEYAPQPNSITAALYVRNMTPVDVVSQLAQACGMPSRKIEAETAKSLEEGVSALSGFLRDTGKRVTVLLDALDELSVTRGRGNGSPGDNLTDLVSKVIHPLIAETAPVIRFLLGGRSNVRSLLGFQEVDDPHGHKVIDLDGDYKDDAALKERIEMMLLGGDTPGAASPWKRAQDTVIRKAVEEIASHAKCSFHAGEEIARGQAVLPELPDVDSDEWKANLPREAGLAMWKELQARLTPARAERALDLLLPLAYGKGNGVPWSAFWLPVANTLRPPGTDPYGEADLNWIYEHAGSWVIESEAKPPDRMLYRLYHESLGFFLRTYDGRASGSRNQPTDEHEIVRSLLSGLRTFDDGSREWSPVSPYIRDHLLEHAIAGGKSSDIDELVMDPGFLAFGHPAEMRATLGQLAEPRHRAVSDVYASALTTLLASSGRITETPSAAGMEDADAYRLMLAQISLAARCRGLDELAARIRAGNGPDEAPWHATWTAWRQQPPHLRLTGSADRVRAVAHARLLDGRVVAVTAGDNGGIRIWDAMHGNLVRHIPHAHNGSVVGLASGMLNNGTEVIVSTGDDYAIHVWAVDSRECIGSFISPRQSVSHAVAVTQLHGDTVVVSGDDHGAVYVWNPVTGRQRRAEYRWEKTAVTALALFELNGNAHVVAAFQSGEVLAWSLVPIRPQVSRRRAGNRPIRALAVGEIDGAPAVVSAGDDCVIQVWDPRSPGGHDVQAHLLVRHTSKIWSLAMAEVGGRPAVISGGADGAARVWDARDGVPIGAAFTGHNAPVRALAAAEVDNRVVVISGGDDPIPRIWDLTAVGAANEPFTGHLDKVKALLFAQVGDGKQIISGSSDATVRRWDPETGAMIGRPLTGHHQWVGALAVADVGGRRCILSGGADTTVLIHDAVSGDLLGNPLKHPAGVTALLVIPVGGVTRVVSACLDGTVLVWDPDSWAEPLCYAGHRNPRDSPRPVWALSAVTIDTAPLVASAGQDGRLHVWDPATANEVLIADSGHAVVTALASVPGHPAWLASGGDDGGVRVRDLSRAAGLERLRRSPGSGAVRALALAAGKESVVVASAHADGTVQFSDLDSFQEIVSHRAHEGQARALAAGVVEGAPAVFSGGDDFVLRLWDPRREAPFQVFHRSPVRSLAVTAAAEGDGIWWVVSGSDDDTVQLRALDRDRAQPERILAAHHKGVRALAVAPATPSVVISGGIDHRLKVWNASTGKLLGPLVGHRDWVRALATGTLPEVGAVVVSASGDGQVAVWDISRRKPIREPARLHSAGIRAVAIAEPGRRGEVLPPVIVSGDTDAVIVITDLATGDRKGEPFTGHSKAIRAIATASLGETRIVISGDQEGTVLAWGLENRNLFGQVPHGPGEVHAIVAQQRGYDEPGCTWVAVAAGDSVTLSAWTVQHGWKERITARFDCDVLAVALPDEYWQDEPPGRIAVGAELGVAVLTAAATGWHGPVR
jgi:WD40 repeat protein